MNPKAITKYRLNPKPLFTMLIILSSRGRDVLGWADISFLGMYTKHTQRTFVINRFIVILF